MSQDKASSFRAKHAADQRPDPIIADAVRLRSKDGRLSCAVAFAIAKETGTDAAEVGKTVDLLDFRLEKCQLGLFGYTPEKKLVKPSEAPDPQLSKAIRAALVKDCLPCETAWKIADRMDIGKMAVSSACETLGVKIKPCQLGAF